MPTPCVSLSEGNQNGDRKGVNFFVIFNQFDLVSFWGYCDERIKEKKARGCCFRRAGAKTAEGRRLGKNI